jgi:hypothetical protein
MGFGHLFGGHKREGSTLGLVRRWAIARAESPDVEDNEGVCMRLSGYFCTFQVAPETFSSVIWLVLLLGFKAVHKMCSTAFY